MRISSTSVRRLCALAGLLLFSACATTQETVQDCRKSAFAFCDQRAKGAEPGTPASGASSRAAYQQCLDVQLAACGVQ
jgi:hypothetical protein